MTLEKGVRNRITAVEADAIYRHSEAGTTNTSHVTRRTVAQVWAELNGGPTANVLRFTRALIAAAVPDIVDVQGGRLVLHQPAPTTRTYILTWNPQQWNWDDLDEVLARALRGETIQRSWATGNTKRIRKGDRLYLLKQGPLPRGIMASGRATSDVDQGPHYDAARADAGDMANYVQLDVERIVEPEAVMAVENITHGALASIHWAMPASGIELPAEAGAELDALWRSFVPPRPGASSANELTPGLQYVEGATQVVTVNRYERSPEARKACIDHWGTSCSVCEMSFAARYGELGAGFINVHHLDPLGASDGEHVVDPVADLRPVCPNCHAMLHRRNPPMTIEELRRHLQ